MTRISQSEFDQFTNLVNENGRKTEVECGSFLHFAAALLIRQTTITEFFVREDRNYFGSTDFIISAKIQTDSLHEETVAYIWELKAPQCYLFEKDDNANRCRPTADYVKAENQLIHYADQAGSDENFRVRFGVMKSRNIKAGGIIIGRADRMINSNHANDLAKARKSLSVRESMLYSAVGIRI